MGGYDRPGGKKKDRGGNKLCEPGVVFVLTNETFSSCDNSSSTDKRGRANATKNAWENELKGERIGVP